MRNRMHRSRSPRLLARAAFLAAGLACPALQAESVFKSENFNVDPSWDGHNNRPATAEAPPPAMNVTQNFGYVSGGTHAGGTAGEIGGFITPTGEAAYYGKVLSTLTFNDAFSASGKIKLDGGGNTLLGFFNSNVVTHNEWRTPDAVVF